MTIKTFHFFKAGTHTTMAGEALTFTPADLQTSALAYSPNERPAPLVVNHPMSDAPPLGRIKSLTAKGDNLYATAEFSQALVDDVKNRRFTGVSAKWFRPDDKRSPRPGTWYLRHVGFLDGVNPAVKGLEPVAFAESACGEAVIAGLTQLEVAFSEALPGDEGGYERERKIMHEMAQLLMKRSPGMSYASAAHTADRFIQNYKARETQGEGMDSDRVAFHEAALDYQKAVPGMSYFAAAQHVLSLR